jgi:hypothetical protein
LIMCASSRMRYFHFLRRNICTIKQKAQAQARANQSMVIDVSVR